MSASLSPSDALSPEAFYSLYLGGLAVDDRSERLQTCYVLLGAGRLGLTPGELLHLHEGWLDWRRGEVHVPAHDPCACRECWNRAQTRQQDGDQRSLAAIVAADCWSPAAKNGERRLSFGWSRRLTAAIDGILGETQTFPGNRQTVTRLVQAAADRARGIDSEMVSVRVLRASAVAFLAEAGFGPRRLADICAIDEATAGEFVRVNGGDTTDHLYRVLDDTDPSTLCGEHSPYRLVCDPAPLDREPFDPTEFDAEWHVARTEQSEQRTRNPRPVQSPDGVSFDPERLGVTEPANDSGPNIVADALTDWVDQYPVPTSDDAVAGGDTGPDEEPGDEIGDTDIETDETPTAIVSDPSGDIESMVTEPVEFTVDTRFAAAGFERGRPTGGTVVLGQAELLFLSRDESGVSKALTVSLDGVANLKPGYTPDSLEGLFEDTVGIAYRDEDDERRIVVTEMPPDLRWQFTQRILAQAMDGQSAVVTHRPTDPGTVGPDERRLVAETGYLGLESTDSEQPVEIPLSKLVAVDYGKLDGETGYEKGLRVDHLERTGTVVRTEIRPTDEADTRLLNRFLCHYLDRKRETLTGESLTPDEREVLDGLYGVDADRTLVSVLDKDPETLSAAVDRLDELGLVVEDNGTQLSGTGYRYVNDEYEL